jgi:hypothetical protein
MSPIGNTGNSGNPQIDTDIKAAKYDLDNKSDLQTLQKDFNKLMQDMQGAKQNGSSPEQSDEMKKILELLMQVIQQMMQAQGGGNQDQSQSSQTVQ